MTRAADFAQYALAATSSVIGQVHDYAGILLPPGYLWADGSAVSRTTYLPLYSVITVPFTATTTSGNATLTVVSTDLRNLGLEGATVEGAGIPAGTTVVSVAQTTITMSANATANASAVSLRLFPYGNGDASTTFNVPDRRGRAGIGRDNMGGSAASRVTTAGSNVNAARLGATGGSQFMQQHNHGITDPGHIHGATTSNTGSDTVVARDTVSGTYNITGGGPTNGFALGGIEIASSTTGISIQNNGSGSSQNMPPVASTNFIIFTGVYP